MPHPDQFRATRLYSHAIWLLIGLCWLIGILTWYFFSSLRVDWQSLWLILVACGFCAITGEYYRRYRQNLNFACTLDTTPQICMLFAGLLIFNYASNTWQMPFYDDVFMMADEKIGFDWQAWVTIFQLEPAVFFLMNIFYNSIYLQFLTLPMFSLVAGIPQRLQVFSMAICVSLLAVMLIAARFPAVGPYAHLGLIGKDSSAVTSLQIPQHLLNVHKLQPILRSHEAHLDFRKAEGMVFFPSFHTACGVIFAWFFWSLRLMRLPMLFVNIMMIIATPACGGHYLADTIAGLLLALISLRAALWAQSFINNNS